VLHWQGGVTQKFGLMSRGDKVNNWPPQRNKVDDSTGDVTMSQQTTDKGLRKHKMLG